MNFTDEQAKELLDIWNQVNIDITIMEQMHIFACGIAKLCIENNENPYQEVIKYWRYIRDVYCNDFLN